MAMLARHIPMHMIKKYILSIFPGLMKPRSNLAKNAIFAPFEYIFHQDKYFVMLEAPRIGR